jgi:hypothetical protein
MAQTVRARFPDYYGSVGLLAMPAWHGHMGCAVAQEADSATMVAELQTVFDMQRTVRRIGVLTSGGDAPGLNAVIRAVVKTAILQHGWEVFGIADGFEGLVGEPRIKPLTLESVSGLLPRGGSTLGCTNRGHSNSTASRALRKEQHFNRRQRRLHGWNSMP